MAGPRELLVVEHEVIDAEAEIDQLMFRKRLSMLWGFGGIPVLVLGIVAVNVFVDYSRPGQGRIGLNFLLGAPLAFSLFMAPTMWFDLRGKLLAVRTKLKKLESERRSILARQNQAVASSFHEYRESVVEIRDSYRQGAAKYRNRHNFFQVSVLVGSILTSVFTTASAEDDGWRWIAVALSATVSISAGVITYFKFRERSMNLQQTADALDMEIQSLNLGIRRYKRLPPEDAAACFAEEVERLKEEQRKKELQLEQPPEAQQRDAAPTGVLAQ
ncbi:DUF4231 domain-containing protein [Kitasatospora griseola]|uniref:DUF4231 domain-containing protein n=1 Tax=Kitasatospora griseola TaxID=2064 RepID=UPI000B090579|nr:DUF4231 domain-containing protein [Kitasatospora griseola]